MNENSDKENLNLLENQVDFDVEDEEEECDDEVIQSGFDEDVGSYVSKELLNGEYIVQIENNEKDFVEYHGDFVDGVREGTGVYRQMNINDVQIDFEYDGEFSNNLPHGKGKSSWNENNAVVYSIEGDFVDGLPDPTQICTVIVEYVATEKTSAVKKTMTVMVSHVSFEKPKSDSPNNLVDIYWQGVFELSGIMSDENGNDVKGVFDIHGNILSQSAGRRSKKINKKKRQSKKRI
jgi:hypothetical protein